MRLPRWRGQQPPRAEARKDLPLSEYGWAALAHLASLPVVALVIAAAGRPLVWAGLAIPLGPAVVVALVRRKSTFVRAHAREALLFGCSVALYAVVLAGGLTLVIRSEYTLVLLPLLLLALLLLAVNWVLFSVLAAIEAGRGAPFSYPLTLRKGGRTTPVRSRRAEER
jgi:uncharacterized protein